MSHPVPMQFHETNLEALATATGRIVVLVGDVAALSAGGRKLDRLMRGALARAVASEAFGKLKPGEALELAYPAGVAADAVQVVKLDKRADVATARKGGAAIGRGLTKAATLVLAEGFARAAECSWIAGAGECW